MGRFILRRLIESVPVFLLVSLLVFLLIRLLPGDPAVVMLGPDVSPGDLSELRHALGLDQPLYVQFAQWLGSLAQGNLGYSVRTHQPVAQAILERLPVTVELTALSLLFSLAIATPAGVISALRRNSAADLASTVVSLIGVSLPNFFIAILLIYFFSLQLRWLPAVGFVALATDPIQNLRSLFMPAIALGAAMAAVVTRLIRSSLLEVLGDDYIRTARGKGLSERTVVLRHALKNALIPVVTVVGLQVSTLLGGAIIVETIFSLPGVGRLIVNSVFQRDFPVTQGAVLFLAAMFITVNLLVDLAYSRLDPRIRYG